MGEVLCPSCGGSGIQTQYRTDENGNSVPVQVTCTGCSGTGRQYT